MKTAKEYRVESKQALAGNWGTAIGVSVLYTIIVWVVSATVIGAIILTGAFSIGISMVMCGLYRNGKMDASDLFGAFTNNSFGSTIGLAVKSGLLIFLWSLLLIVPGIIKAYSYSMAPYILADHPELTGMQAINASEFLMKGKKGKLFCLEISFIGWILLSILTCGILLLMVDPCMRAAKAAFYESIKDDVILPEND